MEKIYQQKMERYSEEYVFENCEREGEVFLVKDAYQKGWHDALQNQWISVEEGLPNIDGNGYSNPVLVKCRLHPNDNIVATYSSLSNLWLSDGLRLEVTHWMEIPSLKGEW